MCLEEGVETRADGEEGDGHNNAHQSVGQDAACRALFVLRRQIALDDGLVGGVGDEVVGQSAEDDYPEGGTLPVEAPYEHLELIVVSSNLPESAGATLGAHDEIGCGQDGTAHEDDALDDIAPDDGFHAAHRTIHDGDDGHQHDTYIYVYTRHGGHGQGGQEDDEGGASHHEDDEQERGHEARGVVEASLQVFIGRRYVEAAEEGQVIPDDGERDEEDANLHRVVGPVGGVSLGGNAHVGDGR